MEYPYCGLDSVDLDSKSCLNHCDSIVFYAVVGIVGAKILSQYGLSWSLLLRIHSLERKNENLLSLYANDMAAKLYTNRWFYMHYAI